MRVTIKKFGKPTKTLDLTPSPDGQTDIEYTLEQAETDSSGYTILKNDVKADMGDTVRDGDVIQLVVKSEGGQA